MRKNRNILIMVFDTSPDLIDKLLQIHDHTIKTGLLDWQVFTDGSL